VVLTDKYVDGWINRVVLGEAFPIPTIPDPAEAAGRDVFAGT
jgi:hypothetical protein